MARIAILTAVVALTACSGDGVSSRDVPAYVQRDSAGIEITENHRPTWSNGEGWTIGAEPLFIIRASDGGAENRLLDPTSIDVDARGRILIGDGNQAGWDAVLVYDSLGRFDFQAGRDGQGPGEFGQLWWASSYRADSIVAFDMSGDKLSIFGPDGDFARLVRTPPLPGETPARGTYGYTAGVDAAFGDGYFLAYARGTLNIEAGPGPAWYEHLLLRLTPDGQAWDTLGTFEISQQYWSGTSQEQLWFAPWSVTAVETDALYFGRGDEFEIRRHDSTGRLTHLLRRAYEPRPVTDELRAQAREWYLDRVRSSPEVNDQILERIRRDLESARFAETVPPYSAILLDDAGYLWVEEFRWFVPNERFPITGPAQWSVFDPSGVWLGNVEIPPGFILRHISSKRVLGFVIDEFDVKEVYAYELDRGVG
jgi:hypothetical protein